VTGYSASRRGWIEPLRERETNNFEDFKRPRSPIKRKPSRPRSQFQENLEQPRKHRIRQNLLRRPPPQVRQNRVQPQNWTKPQQRRLQKRYRQKWKNKRKQKRGKFWDFWNLNNWFYCVLLWNRFFMLKSILKNSPTLLWYIINFGDVG